MSELLHNMLDSQGVFTGVHLRSLKIYRDDQLLIGTNRKKRLIT